MMFSGRSNKSTRVKGRSRKAANQPQGVPANGASATATLAQLHSFEGSSLREQGYILNVKCRAELSPL